MGGGLSAGLYIRVLEEGSFESLESIENLDEVVFMQDNYPAHSAEIVVWCG